MVKDIVFDTCFVRGVIHDYDNLLDIIEKIKPYKNNIKFHIGDAAIAEITLALLEDRILFSDWSERVKIISEILDYEYPVLPGGKELAEISKLENIFYPPEIGGSAYYKELWTLLKDAGKEEDLYSGKEFKLQDGTMVKIKVNLETAQSVFEEERIKWSKYFQTMSLLLKDKNLSQEEIITLIKYGLDKDSTSFPQLSEKVDAMVCALGRFVYLSINDTSPYNPESVKRKGDPFDFSLLQSLSLPAILVTKDLRFKKHIELSNSKQLDMIKLPEEMLTYLSSNLV